MIIASLILAFCSQTLSLGNVSDGEIRAEEIHSAAQDGSDEAKKPASRPVTTSIGIEIGGGFAYSSYLSPLEYSGQSYALSGVWSKDFQRWSDRCVMRFEAEATILDMLNPSRSQSMTGVTAHFGWGLLWRKYLNSKCQLTAGPMLDLYGGALYRAANSNNPVSAIAYVGIDGAASLSYTFSIGSMPVRVEDYVSVPTAGAFFMPQYGESYYEIYLGNRRGLVHFGWFGNAIGVNNRLSATLKLGRTSLTVGTTFRFRNWSANGLRMRLVQPSLLVTATY